MLGSKGGLLGFCWGFAGGYLGSAGGLQGGAGVRAGTPPHRRSDGGLFHTGTSACTSAQLSTSVVDCTYALNVLAANPPSPIYIHAQIDEAHAFDNHVHSGNFPPSMLSKFRHWPHTMASGESRGLSTQRCGTTLLSTRNFKEMMPLSKVVGQTL